MTGPLLKPSRLDRLVQQQAKRRHKRRAQLDAEAASRIRWQGVRLEVFRRDHSRCRACGRHVRFTASNPLLVGQVHHVVYRSAGGTDALTNLVLLCAQCHDDEHRHLLLVSGTAGRLTVCRRQEEWRP